MATPKRIAVEDSTGDGPLLRIMPGQARARLRPLFMRNQKQKEKRLLRVARAIFPGLQSMEAMAVADQHRLLTKRGFDACLNDHKCIERALTLFDVAWQTGLTDLKSFAKGAPLAWGNTRTQLGACGLTVGQAQQFFLKIAVRMVYKENPKAYDRLKDFIDERSSLPRMRLLASIDALTLAELQTGWGRRFCELLTTKDDDFALAVRRLKPFQARSVRQVMTDKFTEALDWAADMWVAIAESFQCVEQFRDMGEFFLDLTSPEAVRAIGRWERRDITEKVNADRRKKGKKPVKGRRWETDISHIKRILGNSFTTLVQRDAALIDLFGEIYSGRIRDLEEPARGQAVEQFQLLARRYLEYLTAPMLEALMRPQEDETLSFGEIVNILEGLWMKNGLGTAFFETTFQAADGVEGVRGVACEYIDMKRRGSAKQNTDIAALIRDSDLFDRWLVPMMRKNKRTSPT